MRLIVSVIGGGVIGLVMGVLVEQPLSVIFTIGGAIIFAAFIGPLLVKR